MWKKHTLERETNAVIMWYLFKFLFIKDKDKVKELINDMDTKDVSLINPKTLAKRAFKIYYKEELL